MKDVKRAGVVKIGPELLAAVLGLDVDHSVYTVLPPSRGSAIDGYVEVVVEGPSMPEARSGQVLQNIDLQGLEAARPRYCEGR